MPWYKSGTVSVTQNSNAVIGTGTAFISNARVGDAFRGPDGGWYEVTNIASDTALAISPNYQGVTNSAGIYALAPMQGYVKDSADALRALVNQYGTQLAALGTTGNYDILPPNKGGTGITDLSAYIQGLLNDPDASSARLTLGSAKSGANNDITSLTGLITALSVAQGGTGVTSIAALLAALQAAGAYGKSNAVGAVSQTGGIPTGAIVESGSNSNGTYAKYIDGTLICRSPPMALTGPTISFGALFLSPLAADWTFPASFVGVSPAVSGSTGNDPAFIVSGRSTSISSASFVGIYPASAPPAWTIYTTAIGRWF
ncbi:phage tail protein [Pseudomonas sp. Irchel s3b5]|uniref:phage tail protein n=1 Tax=Pseudomonas sp. Irchel s3b5 TaxID=2009077 RepID=UPI002114E6BF|nr:phage tail protein [Pseudomonas sp. Irchel s3b5]